MDSSRLFIFYLLAVNALTLIVFGWDKRLSRRGLSRISEQTLWCLCILGGSLGGWAGMYLFKHKTRHFKFRLGVPIILLAQVVVFIYCYNNLF